MKIFCVGMNYAQHNKSGGNALIKTEKPVIFLKADSSLLKNGKPFFLPDSLGSVSYGSQLVARVSRLGKSVPLRFAHRYYDALTVGVGFTAVDMLERLSSRGLPWDLATSFDGAAVIGSWIDKTELPEAQNLKFSLTVNGRPAQQATASEMLMSIDETVACVSRTFTLKTGDLIFMGTPEGSEAVAVDDHLEGWLCERKVLDFYCK